MATTGTEEDYVRSPRKTATAASWAEEHAGAGQLLTVVMNERFELLGVAFHGEHDGALLDAISRDGHGRDDLPAIGKAETHRKRAVRPQFDRFTLERDPGLGFGGTIDNQFRVQLEPKLTSPAGQPGARAEARHRR